MTVRNLPVLKQNYGLSIFFRDSLFEFVEGDYALFFYFTLWRQIMINQEKIRLAMEMMIEAIGEDGEREGLLDTPKRVAKMFAEIFSGIEEDPRVHLQTIFNTDHDEMVLVKDISFYSMCEHHFLPFFGKVSVAYIPKNGKITGLSKLARVVDCIAKRPQLQERLTYSIDDIIMECLEPEGVAVVVDAAH